MSDGGVGGGVGGGGGGGVWVGGGVSEGSLHPFLMLSQLTFLLT